jgi:hypothetical protein
VDIERRDNDWLGSLSWEERADIYAAGEHPSERALAAVADQATVDIDELHSAVVRTSGDGMEIVVRRRR